jgi:putative phosphoribosyl transferase
VLRIVTFSDRRDAGMRLAEVLAGLGPVDPLVLALPRGGVPVGYEVSLRLGCPLDILLVRKVGVPDQPELAMGAVAEGGVVVRNEEMVRLAGVDERRFREVLDREVSNLARQTGSLRPPGTGPVDPAGHTCLVVDDGLATGATALAAVDALREQGATEVWVCVPVGPQDTVRALEQVADRVVVVEIPHRFGAVGAWYRDFSQVTDDEVRDLIGEARLRFRQPNDEEP